MSEVKRYGRIGDMVEATEGLLKLYPMMSVYVLAADFDRVTAERDALAQNLKFAEEGSQSFAEECDALQRRLTAADELLTDAVALLECVTDTGELTRETHSELEAEICVVVKRFWSRERAELKPAEADPDFRMIGIEKMPPMEFDEP